MNFNFTRILGLNDKIYKKFGDYCIAELDNECYIVCSSCQEEHQTEDSFWQHIREAHQQALPCALQQELKYEPTETNHNSPKQSIASPMYVEAEYLEQLGDINDPDILEDLSPYIVQDVQSLKAKTKQTKSNIPPNHAKQSPLSPVKYFDIERISSKSLLNGKVLKKLFLQFKRTHIEFKYKLNRLTQELKVLEREQRDDVYTQRKKYMKILPDSPLSTRDEVLILDGELQRSKEMRSNLFDEALMVTTESPDVYCRVLWRFIMSDEVSCQFCWRGVIDGERVLKYPIKDMIMLDIFQSAFRDKFPALPLNTFKEKTITYFHKANDRVKRNKMKVDEAVSDEPFDEVY